MKLHTYFVRSSALLILCVFGLIFLHSCALELELFSVEEASLMAEEEASLVAESNIGRYSADGAYILENPSGLSAEFRQVKLSRTIGTPPRLYIIRNGTPQYVAEIVDESTVKFIQSNIKRSLPGRLYTIDGDGVRVRSSSFHSDDYNVFAHVNRDQIALVLGPEDEGFLEVQLVGIDTVGWISKKYLRPAVDSTFNGRQTEIQSRYINGNVCEKYQTIDGLKSGQYYFYHLNGRLWCQRNYAKGKLVSVYSNFDAEGHPLNIGSFTNGNGYLNIYNESGQLICIENYSNGYLSSKQTVYNNPTNTTEPPKTTYALPWETNSETNQPYNGDGHPYTGDKHPYTGDGHPYVSTLPQPIAVPPTANISQTITYSGIYSNSITVKNNSVVILTGIASGSITIEENSNLTVKGIISGTIIINKNSILINYGTISGSIINYGGQIENHGVMSGVITNASQK
jgi:antitoxin component YwqK of YwqJK toxin-antitoxin module